MNDLKFNQELFVNFIPDAIEMMHDHNKEIDLFNKDLEIHTDFYLRAEENGILKVYTIRDNQDGKLIGYCAFFIFRHSHHAQSVQAKQDVLYIEPKYRGGLGRRFIEYCDSELKKVGVEYVHQCVPATNDWSRLLENLNYKKLETVYLKEL